MTLAEAAELLAWLALRFPSQNLSEASLKAYSYALASYPPELAKRAGERLSISSRFFPSLSEIVREIVELAIDIPAPEAAWNELLRRNADDDWSDLDPIMRQALRAAGGTHAIASQESHFVRRAFLDAYSSLRSELATRTREIDLPSLEHARIKALTSVNTDARALLERSSRG